METIRPASLDDAAGIARVHVDSWKTTYKGSFPDTILQFSYEWHECLWQRILDEYQHQGLGRRLVKALAEELLQYCFSSMRLWVMRGNPAERFYSSLGGQPTEAEQETSYGVTTTIVSYGWRDIQPLLLRE